MSRSSFRNGNMKEGVSVQDRAKAPPNKRARAESGAPATDGRSPSLWFGAPTDDQDRRPQLTRERVVEEALTVIAHDGANALTMRRLAPRLGAVPGPLYPPAPPRTRRRRGVDRPPPRRPQRSDHAPPGRPPRGRPRRPLPSRPQQTTASRPAPRRRPGRGRPPPRPLVGLDRAAQGPGPPAPPGARGPSRRGWNPQDP